LILIRRSLLVLLLICLGCVAQSAPPDVARKIERNVRSFYNLPPEVKVTVGGITANSDVPGYDSVAVNIDGGEGNDIIEGIGDRTRGHHRRHGMPAGAGLWLPEIRPRSAKRWPRVWLSPGASGH